MSLKILTIISLLVCLSEATGVYNNYYSNAPLLLTATSRPQFLTPFVGISNHHHHHHHRGPSYLGRVHNNGREPTTGLYASNLRPAANGSPAPIAGNQQLCAATNQWLFNATTEKQLQAYISGIEALTGTIQELDEAVQQIRPAPKSCQVEGGDQINVSPKVDGETLLAAIPAPSPAAPVAPLASSTPSPDPVDSPAAASTVAAAVSGPNPGEEPASTTTESFTDPPPTTSLPGRARRDYPFGMPHFAGGNAAAGLAEGAQNGLDQTGEDLLKASNDLKTLRKDLSVTAEWLRQTNYTVHSVMLKALQAYVTSIERRVDNQLQLYKQTRMSGLKTKIAVIKEKVASLIERLKSLVPFKVNNGTNVISRDDQVSSPATGAPPARVPLVTNNS